tara:strand:+ start:5872 stop:6129 length:258 start_codon:yes stop_codon:yes gene_type:complete
MAIGMKKSKAKGYADTRQATGSSIIKKNIRKHGVADPAFGFRNPNDPPGGYFPYPYKSAEPTKAVRINWNISKSFIPKRKKLGDY